jgi:mRNA interferase RelE/StbE
MKARIAYKASVKKDLKGLDRKAVLRILDSIESDLAAHPGKDKVLKGQFDGLFSYRVGDYRVIYNIIGRTILVLRIAHRRESYQGCGEPWVRP